MADAGKWQTSRSTIRERNQYMYNNSMFSDVQFSVIDSKGDTITVPAHKYVLAISSPVFEAMFYGELAETRRTIDLPDCTAEGLLELFRNMYYDKVQLTGSHVMEVLYLAKKYFVPSLVKKCTQYLEKELGPEDVFTVLPQAARLEDEKLTEICWTIVDCETQRAVTSEPFLIVTQETLCDILERDTLNIREIELFQAVDQWAASQSKQKGLSGDGKSKRSVLGEKAVHLIRFPLMSQREFAEVVVASRILNMEEVIELIQFYNSVIGSSAAFSANKRMMKSKGYSCKRFKFGYIEESNIFGWQYNEGKLDCTRFTVNQQVNLTGVRLFGSEGSRYHVKLTVIGVGIEEPYKEIYRSTHNNNDSEMSDGYYGFTITLNTPIRLDSDVKYIIKALIDGPNSWYGVEGRQEIEVEGIRF